ncbi:SPOSA6832_00126 [Sporobolomyces salmonicolor]|uniref:SPOSA6832_00126-mRNA-1:cds n=1 Tax=Sporidiobolus salmonicolor TaxID=5005 RepID=A0A0D6EFZ1_SPOSA|nr:SPOSA6832_00126 [Sporobolomyces salmonicolor]
MSVVVTTEPITDGVVLLKTTLGDILIELWRREAPKAVRKLTLSSSTGHYDGAPFHRVMPGFIAQTGGEDECIYDEGSFEVETNQRLKFNRRGLVAMASDPDTKSNMSQFFFTLDATPDLQNKHTIFGRIAGDTLFNVLKLNEIELEPGTDRPVYPPLIKSVEVKIDPFEDTHEPIKPRITAQERKEQEKAKREMKVERAKQREQSKRKGTKNKSLLSFGEEAEDLADDSLPKTKFKSAHDVATDGRLSSKVIDDRGTSATLPPELMGAPPVPKKRRGDEDERREEKRSRSDAPSAPSTSKLEEARALKAKAPKSEAERRKEEIAKVQAELKKMSRADVSDDEDGKPAKKPKRSGPSLLQLEREKYIRGGASKASRGKRKADDDDDVMDVLAGFRNKLTEAAKAAPAQDDEDAHKPEKLHGIDLNDDELDDDDAGWLSHSLRFRKDATLDQHNIDEYAVVDPLAKEQRTLDEMRANADNSRSRRYAGEREQGRDERRGGGGGGGGGGDRYGAGRERERFGDRRGGEQRGGGGAGGRGSEQWGRDRPEVRGDWKQDRMSTADLA